MGKEPSFLMNCDDTRVFCFMRRFCHKDNTAFLMDLFFYYRKGANLKSAYAQFEYKLDGCIILGIFE